MQPTWTGVYPALTTPFHADESLDLDTWVRKVRAQVAAGVDGLILGGSLGEASTLESAELIDLLQATRATVEGEVPVVLNVACRRTKDALQLVHRAAESGADGLMVLPPLRYAADRDEVTTWFTALAHETELPILLYNNPVDYGIGLDLGQFETLLRLPTIQAVKESTRDVTQVIRLKRAFGDDLRVLCGVDTLALESAAIGADGWVAGLVNAFPRETVLLWQWMQEGRLAEARDLYHWFMPLLELDIHPKLVQYIKLAEREVGLGTPFVRAPRQPLEDEELTRILSIIRQGIEQRPDLANEEV